MRLLAVSIAALALVAGCGGSEVTVQEVPGDPVDLAVPGKADALAPAATAEPTATETPTEQPAEAAAAAPPATTEEGPGTQVPEGTEGGGTAAPDGEDGAGADEPPPPGADAEQFETFCAQNPGAC